MRTTERGVLSINYQIDLPCQLENRQIGTVRVQLGTEFGEAAEGSIQLTVLRSGVFSSQQLIPHGLELPRPESQTET